MTIEGLKAVFDWVAVILLFLTFASGVGVLITGNIINKRQAVQLREFDQSLTAAKIELGKQQVRAANADARVAGVETELTKQKERTAIAEKAASDAALSLARFKQPRTLSSEQQHELIAGLKPFAGQNFAFAVFPDPEPQGLTRVLDELLKSAGWNRVRAQIQREGAGILMDIAGESAAQISDSGIYAYIAPEDQESVPAQKAFCSALIAAGIQCETHRTPQLAGKTPRAITISVGKKP